MSPSNKRKTTGHKKAETLTEKREVELPANRQDTSVYYPNARPQSSTVRGGFNINISKTGVTIVGSEPTFD